MPTAPSPTRPSPIRRLLRYLAPQRRRVWLAFTCSLLNKFFDLAPPLLIGAAVDVVVKREDSLLASWGLVNPMGQLVALAVATVVIWGLESLFEYWQALLWRNLAQDVQHDLRLDAYGHIQDLDMAWFAEQRSGRLMAILNDDVNQLERFLDSGADQLVQIGATVVLVSAAFFYIAPGVALLAMGPIPIILWGSFAFQKAIAPRYAAVREGASSIAAQLGDNLAGMETIKSFTAEGLETKRIGGASSAYRSLNQRAISLSSAFTPLIRIAIVLGFVATLVEGGRLTLNGTLAVGTYSVLVFLTQRLLWPLTRLGATVDLYQRAMASTERILDLLDLDLRLTDGSQDLPNNDGARGLSVNGVTFSYPEREPVLRGIDLDIPAGSTVALVGPTGSGKSTLLRLLLRFHDPQEGSVKLDGADLRDLKLAELRGALGLVSQTVFLFPGSVRSNVAYGRADAGDDAVQAAAQAAEAHDFVAAMPDGYDTDIGEWGGKLSGGQRQRLSLARAVLKDPPVLLLDEATSAVDSETEAAIQRSLARIAVGRTMVVVAHRLSTVQDADNIVVLDAGEIVEQGRHEELLAADGLYARMWAAQIERK